MPCWNCIPLLLIATAALLIDKSLILPRDRIYVQVFLWLAAALQPPLTATAETTSAFESNDWVIQSMVHIVFLANLLQHVALFQEFCQRQRRRQQHAKEYLRMIGASAWISLMYLCYAWPSLDASNPEQQENNESICIQRSWCVFGMSWLVLALYTWQTIRTRMIIMSRRGDTTVGVGAMARNSLNPTSVEPLDLRSWYEWSPSQVSGWILSLATQGDEAESVRNLVVSEDSTHCLNNQHDWQQVLHLLAPEQIAGAELPGLTVQDLRCIMSIPYGTASRLVREIQRLIVKYPAPFALQTYNSGRGTATAFSRHEEDKENGTSSWLPRYFSDYYDGYARHDEKRQDEPIVNDGFGEYNSPISEEHHQHARDILKRRFGFEMPIMATGTNAHHESVETQQAQQSTRNERHDQQVHRVQQQMQEQQPSFLRELPPQILESMPRHIQEICHRNPELLRQVLAMKQNGQQTNKKLSPFISTDINDDVPFPELPNTPDAPFHPRVRQSHTQIQSDPGAGGIHDDGDDDDDDGEHTELLRKRRVGFNLYRATS